MKLFFAGVENNEWRNFLADLEVQYVSMSFVGLSKRVKGTNKWSVAEHFKGQHVLLDAGGYSFNKADASVTEEQAMDMATAYMSFVTQNIDAVDLVTEFDANILGRDWLLAMREDFYDDLGDKFCPVWHDDTGTAELERLASKYGHVGILAGGLDDHIAPVLNNLVSRYGVKLHGLGITATKTSLCQAVKWDSIGSKSWISPSIDGDTIIWTGNELKRYPARLKEQSRKRHKSYVERQGFDADKILGDDRKEVLRLSVWSWQQFMTSLDRAKVFNPFGGGPIGVTPQGDHGTDDSGEQDPAAVDLPSPTSENGGLLPVLAEKREHELLPVMGIEVITTKSEDKDSEDFEERLVTTPSKSPLLQCNSCYINAQCPKAKANAECAYEIPIQVTSKNQMRRLQDALIEMQYQRTARMVMFEQALGGYSDQNASAEIDRLQKLMNAKREAERTGFSIHVEAHDDKGVGTMSRLFGRDAGDAVTALPEAVDSVEYLEAEVISDTNDSTNGVTPQA